MTSVLLGGGVGGGLVCGGQSVGSVVSRAVLTVASVWMAGSRRCEARSVLRRSWMVQRGIRTVSREFPAEQRHGSLKVRLPKRCVFEVCTQDPFKSNVCEVAVDVVDKAGKDEISQELAEGIIDDLDLHIVADTRRNVLRIESSEETTPHWLGRQGRMLTNFLHLPNAPSRFDAHVTVKATVPSNYDVDLEVCSGLLRVLGSFEGNESRIYTQAADVEFDSFQSGNIDVETYSGTVRGVLLNGNISIRTRSGSVSVGRLQGESVRCITETGHMNIGSIYGDYNMLRTERGDIRVANVSGKTSIRSHDGDLHIHGGEGDLDLEATYGDTNLQLSLPRDVFVRCYNGNIRVGLPPSLLADIDLEGERVVLDDDFRFQHLGVRDKVVLGMLSGSRLNPPRRLPWKSNVFARAPRGFVDAFPQTWGMLTASAQPNVVSKTDDASSLGNAAQRATKTQEHGAEAETPARTGRSGVSRFGQLRHDRADAATAAARMLEAETPKEKLLKHNSERCLENNQ